MHVVTAIKTDKMNFNFVLESLEKLHMHIDSITKRSNSIEIVADAQTQTPDELIYERLYKIAGVKKIFAKVLQNNKELYA